MVETVQVKAEIPRSLKRRAFAALALREQHFNSWLKTELEELLRESEGCDEERESKDRADHMAR